MLNLISSLGIIFSEQDIVFDTNLLFLCLEIVDYYLGRLNFGLGFCTKLLWAVKLYLCLAKINFHVASFIFNNLSVQRMVSNEPILSGMFID